MNKQQQELYEKLLKKVNEYCLGAAAEDVIEAIDNLVDEYECTGQTPFKILNAIKEQMPKYDEKGTVEITKKDIRYIETALKALEIIKKKILDMDYFNVIAVNCDLTSQEYEFLRKVLTDERTN